MSTPSLPAPLRPFLDNGQRNRGVPFPDIGDLIFIRIPFTLPGPTITRPTTSTSTSRRSQKPPYHPCIVSATFPKGSEFRMRVFICRSFTSNCPGNDPRAWVEGLESTDKESLILLEPTMEGPTPLELPPPTGLMPPITMEGFKLKRMTWVIAYEVEILLSKYKPCDGHLSLEELQRLQDHSKMLESTVFSANVLPTAALQRNWVFALEGPAINLGRIECYSDDDDDDEEDEEDDRMGMADFMEWFHNAAAPTNARSAAIAKKNADRRKMLLEDRVLTWVNDIS